MATTETPTFFKKEIEGVFWIPLGRSPLNGISRCDAWSAFFVAIRWHALLFIPRALADILCGLFALIALLSPLRHGALCRTVRELQRLRDLRYAVAIADDAIELGNEYDTNTHPSDRQEASQIVHSRAAENFLPAAVELDAHGTVSPLAPADGLRQPLIQESPIAPPTVPPSAPPLAALKNPPSESPTTPNSISSPSAPLLEETPGAGDEKHILAGGEEGAGSSEAAAPTKSPECLQRDANGHSEAVLTLQVFADSATTQFPVYIFKKSFLDELVTLGSGSGLHERLPSAEDMIQVATVESGQILELEGRSFLGFYKIISCLGRSYFPGVGGYIATELSSTGGYWLRVPPLAAAAAGGGGRGAALGVLGTDKKDLGDINKKVNDSPHAGGASGDSIIRADIATANTDSFNQTALLVAAHNESPEYETLGADSRALSGMNSAAAFILENRIPSRSRIHGEDGNDDDDPWAVLSTRRYQSKMRLACVYYGAIALVDLMMLPFLLPLWITQYRYRPVHSVLSATDQWGSNEFCIVMRQFGLLVLDLPFLPLCALLCCCGFRWKPVREAIRRDDLKSSTSFLVYAAALRGLLLTACDILVSPFALLLLLTWYRSDAMRKLFMTSTLWHKNPPWFYGIVILNFFIVLHDTLLLLPATALVAALAWWRTRYILVTIGWEYLKMYMASATASGGALVRAAPASTNLIVAAETETEEQRMQRAAAELRARDSEAAAELDRISLWISTHEVPIWGWRGLFWVEFIYFFIDLFFVPFAVVVTVTLWRAGLMWKGIYRYFPSFSIPTADRARREFRARGVIMTEFMKLLRDIVFLIPFSVVTITLFRLPGVLLDLAARAAGKALNEEPLLEVTDCVMDFPDRGGPTIRITASVRGHESGSQATGAENTLSTKQSDSLSSVEKDDRLGDRHWGAPPAPIVEPSAPPAPNVEPSAPPAAALLPQGTQESDEKNDKLQLAVYNSSSEWSASAPALNLASASVVGRTRSQSRTKQGSKYGAVGLGGDGSSDDADVESGLGVKAGEKPQIGFTSKHLQAITISSNKPAKLFVVGSNFWDAVSVSFGSTVATVGKAMLPLKLQQDKQIDLIKINEGLAQVINGSSDRVHLEFELDTGNVKRESIVKNIAKLSGSVTAVLQLEVTASVSAPVTASATQNVENKKSSKVLLRFCPTVSEIRDCAAVGRAPLPSSALDASGVRYAIVMADDSQDDDDADGVVNSFYMIVGLAFVELVVDFYHILLSLLTTCLVPWRGLELLMTLCEPAAYAPIRMARKAYDQMAAADDLLLEFRDELAPAVNTYAKSYLVYGDYADISTDLQKLEETHLSQYKALCAKTMKTLDFEMCQDFAPLFLERQRIQNALIHFWLLRAAAYSSLGSGSK